MRRSSLTSSSMGQQRVEDENGLCLVSDAQLEFPKTLLSLPVELLLEIAAYCRLSDARSLATVCKRLHDVAIYRLYTLIALCAGKLVPKKLHRSLGNISTEEALHLHAGYPRGGMLCGLLARQEHLDALRTLLIPSAPKSCTSNYGRHANTIVRDVISRARNLQHLSLPIFEHDSRSYQASLIQGLGLDFSGLQWPASLTSLYLEMPPQNTTALRPLLGQISSLVIKDIGPIHKDQMLDIGLGPYLRHLDCRWTLGDVGNDPEPQLDSIRNFITVLSNLETLSISISYHSQGEFRWVDAHRSPGIFEGFIAPLKYLRVLKLLHFDVLWDYGRQQLALENSRILQLADTCPSLEQVVVHHTWYVSWKRCTPRDEAVEGTPVWLPDPIGMSQWSIWFDKYTTPELVEQRMHQFWGEKRSIPRLNQLQRFLREVYRR